MQHGQASIQHLQRVKLVTQVCILVLAFFPGVSFFPGVYTCTPPASKEQESICCFVPCTCHAKSAAWTNRVISPGMWLILAIHA